MAYLRDLSFAEAPAPVVCDTEIPSAVIRGFEFDRHAVPGTERVTIDKLAADIRGGRVGKLRLVGHTDAVGTAAYNHKLGLDRAHAVLQALRGIIGQMPLDFSLESKGAACPLAQGTTELARRQNRRVEVIVAPPPPKPRPMDRPAPGRPAEILPLPPPLQPQIFCLGGQIGCKTLSFIRDRRARTGALTPDDEVRAIDIEHNLLMAHPDLSNLPPIHPGRRQNWMQQRREEATRRVNRVLAGMIK
jgi:hypothetical protein